MELFKQYNVEFVSCTEKFDTSTLMGRAMPQYLHRVRQLERESIQMRAGRFYSGVPKGYYMRGRVPFGFDTEPIVMDGIKTKRLVENAEMDYAELICMKCMPSRRTPTATLPGILPRMKSWCMEETLKRGFVGQL